jgi:hypothetical protein
MQLHKIDMIGLEPLKCRIGRPRDGVGGKILWDFTLTAPAGFTVRDKVIAHFCCDHDFVPIRRKRFGDEFLAQAISISVGGIEQSNTEIEGPVHEGDGFAFGEIAPPTGRDRPEAEADFAHREIGVFVSAKTHQAMMHHEGHEDHEVLLRMNLRALRDLRG